MSSKSIWWGKVISAQLLAFVTAGFLINNVFIGPTPIVRPEAKLAFYNLPQTVLQLAKNLPNQIASSTKYLSSGATLAPPWVDISSSIHRQSNRNIFPTGAATPISNNNPLPTSVNDSDPTPTPRIYVRLPTLPPLSTLPPLPTFSLRPTTTNNDGGSSRGTPVPTVSSPPPPPTDTANLESQIISLINSRRAQDGLSKVTQNSQLTAAARRHSNDISKNNNCGHTGSDGSDPFKRARESGFTGAVYGETVACRHRTPESAVSGWWSSPPHHRILTNSGIKQIGVGWAGNYQTALVGY